jgi:uncharacterized iron-regulated membrane protein
MTRLRPVLFWMHFTAGAIAGGVVMVMSTTGVLLAFKPQVVAFVDRGVRTPITVVDGATARYVDPASGAITGETDRRTQAFFKSVEAWHRWLAAADAHRATARAVTGACNLLFFVLAVSGPILWWPRRWSWQNVRSVLWFRRTATRRSRDFNWHNVAGIWMAPALAILTSTGVVMSYRWANDLLYRVAGSTPPAAAARTAAAPRNPASAAPPTNLGAVIARARATVPAWRSMIIRPPARGGAPAIVSISDRRSWNAFARSQLTIDARTGAVVKWEPYAASSRGQKLRGWARFAHTGELFGMPGQVVAAAACAAGMLLVWTGLALAVRRLASAARLRNEHRDRQRDHRADGEPRYDVVPLRVDVAPHQLAVVDEE